MSTQFPEIFAALAAPFDQAEVKARSENGRQMHYITARTAMNRLDAVLGPENWWPETTPACDGTNSYLCRLTVVLPDGKAITKTAIGGGGGKEGSSAAKPKAGDSDALKRAAVLFGVGRYLYRDGVPRFAAGREPGCDEPEPDRARPQPAPPPRRPPHDDRSAERTHVNTPAHQGAPRTGKALFAWTKDQEQQHEVSLLKYISGWAKLQEFPGRMVEWDAQQVERAYAEACRKLSSYKRSDELQESLAHAN